MLLPVRLLRMRCVNALLLMLLILNVRRSKLKLLVFVTSGVLIIGVALGVHVVHCGHFLRRRRCLLRFLARGLLLLWNVRDRRRFRISSFVQIFSSRLLFSSCSCNRSSRRGNFPPFRFFHAHHNQMSTAIPETDRLMYFLPKPTDRYPRIQNHKKLRTQNLD